MLVITGIELNIIDKPIILNRTNWKDTFYLNEILSNISKSRDEILKAYQFDN